MKNDSNCFICAPDKELVFDKSDYGYAMAGLGPITYGYSLVCSNRHVPIISGLSSDERRGYISYTENIRKALALHYGSCLMTEHGKMPICGSRNKVNTHCFHPHFLLFPNATDITGKAAEYCLESQHFSSLDLAITYGEQHDQYLLISQEHGSYYIFISPNGFPRQYARLLVAESIGKTELASWRDFPNISKVKMISKSHSELFKDN